MINYECCATRFLRPFATKKSISAAAVEVAKLYNDVVFSRKNRKNTLWPNYVVAHVLFLPFLHSSEEDGLAQDSFVTRFLEA